MVLLSMEEFMYEFNFDSQTNVKIQIKAGMPYRMDGRCYRFDLDECRYWFRLGWFESLSDDEKRLKYKQFRGLVKRKGITR